MDDGKRRKWVLVVRLQDLPTNLPLDANARIPNVLRNRQACSAMRATLLEQPELFQILNGGIVCTADGLEIRQKENTTEVTISFDPSGGQGIVNGGHSYATAIEVAHGVTTHSDGKELLVVLAEDTRHGREGLRELIENPQLLGERVAKARQEACIQIEVVAPIPDAEFLAQVAVARNLSQGVEATAFANLAGKFDRMKGSLVSAFGPEFVNRVIWKTNQEAPDGSREIPVKLLVHILALMNFRAYQPGVRLANEVFSRKGLVIRDFVEAEGDAQIAFDCLTDVLPALIDLYDHMYASIADSDPNYPWMTGNLREDVRRRGAFTPFFSVPCPTRVADAFIWPLFSAFRLLLSQAKPTQPVKFLCNPIELFDEKRQELLQKLKEFHQDQAHGLIQQVGRDKELWLRLEGIIELEIKMRRRLQTLGPELPAAPRAHRRVQAQTELGEAEEVNGEPPTRPASFSFNGARHPVSTWKDIYTSVAAILARTHTDFETRAQLLRGRTRPYFSRYPNGMHAPHRLQGTNLFIETCFSAKDTLRRVNELLAAFGHSSIDLNVEVRQ
jgi:hypothetical protein